MTDSSPPSNKDDHRGSVRTQDSSNLWGHTNLESAGEIQTELQSQALSAKGPVWTEKKDKSQALVLFPDLLLAVSASVATSLGLSACAVCGGREKRRGKRKENGG